MTFISINEATADISLRTLCQSSPYGCLLPKEAEISSSGSNVASNSNSIPSKPISISPSVDVKAT